MSRVNECLRLVRMSNRRVNEVRVGLNESVVHRDKKVEVCERLEREGKSFVTEAIFLNGSRADVLVLDDFKVVEILHTEKDESIEKKREMYPSGLSFELVRC